jgi:hypothetical protein
LVVFTENLPLLRFAEYDGELHGCFAYSRCASPILIALCTRTHCGR